MADDGEDNAAREAEVEVLRSMFTEEELRFPDDFEPFFFTLQVLVEDAEGGDDVTCELSIFLPPGFPGVAAEISVGCDKIRRAQNDVLKKALYTALGDVAEGELQVLFVVEWIKENLATYYSAITSLAATSASGSSPAPRRPKGFMREWCSFVSLYKDSYISGPNRFEVMISLARERGLNITGMGIAGKPGGMVCEGEEGDLVEFMELMRTVFFETLNPRGRKLTTRLQERWPLDDELDRFEAAEVVCRLRDDAYRAEAREKVLTKFKAGEKERLEKFEADDRARLQRWEAKTGRKMDDAEASKLVEAGPPAKCTTQGIYDRCGCEAPPTLDEIEAHRLFKDFTVFTGKEGFEASYQEAAKIFKELGRMDGFDAMFTYRFS
eukprot:TRINITY_DN49665_c0_g1_i1.p1 TRINITY_DN49665_c0_g1~~TRINITY_DN49665_c0_g1_i1.p1  ORF type:complete len:381 (+),score=84.12 TRINITY_DN49665_c0_g1_i1:60-1202(+)